MRRRFITNIIDSSTGVDMSNYLTIRALEDNVSISFSNFCDISINGVVWMYVEENKPITVNNDTCIYVKNELQSTGVAGSGYFTVTGNFALEGNCMSMLFGDNAKDAYDLTKYSYAFKNMFKNCTGLQSVSKHFLPATTLAMDCYQGMFSGCTSLTTAPELPATTLADYCYDYMFYGCKKLNYIKMLATDISAYSCLKNWVNGVSSTGTFVKNKDATWDAVGVSGVPVGWTVITDYMLEYIGGKENLITFRVEIRRFAAKKDMTWKEWCNTPMNSSNDIYINGGIVYSGTNMLINNGVVVREDDVIINGADYALKRSEPA